MPRLILRFFVCLFVCLQAFFQLRRQERALQLLAVLLGRFNALPRSESAVSLPVTEAEGGDISGSQLTNTHAALWSAGPCAGPRRQRGSGPDLVLKMRGQEKR